MASPGASNNGLPVLVVLVLAASFLAVSASAVGGQTGETCDGVAATIVGTEGRDVLLGTDGPDVIVGLGGNDVIRGLAGDDLICGGNGRDRLFGGPGADTIFGGLKNDILKGDQGPDALYGNQGNDRIIGGGGGDVLEGGSGLRDRLIGKGGVDTAIDRQSTFTTQIDTCETIDVPIGYEVTGTLTEGGTGDPWSGVTVTLTDESDPAIGEVAQATTGEDGSFVLRYTGAAEERPHDVVAGLGTPVCRKRILLSSSSPSAEVDIVYPPCG